MSGVAGVLDLVCAVAAVVDAVRAAADVVASVVDPGQVVAATPKPSLPEPDTNVTFPGELNKKISQLMGLGLKVLWLGGFFGSILAGLKIMKAYREQDPDFRFGPALAVLAGLLFGGSGAAFADWLVF